MEQSNTIKQNKMGTEPVFKLIMSMSLPAIFSMLVQSLYNIVDSIFVSQINENALTAVSLAAPMQFLIIAVAVGTGIGLNSLVSRRLGEKNFTDANSAATHGIVLGIASWLVFAVIGFFAAEPFLKAFTDDAEVVQMGCDYLSVVLIFSLGIFVEINLEKTLQATGNMMYPMLFQLTGAITNIILDPIFIFGFKMGVRGAAVATVIGQVLSMLFALYISLTKSHDVKISFKGFKLRGKIIADIYKVGFPSIVMQSVAALLNVCLNGILIGFSGSAVAVLGVYYKIQSFVFMPVFGLTHGVMPIMGYNFGARNKERLLKALKYGIYIALCIMGTGMALFWLIPAQLLGMFNPTDEMLRIGVPALRIISLCFIPAALGILFSTLFQAVGMGVKSLTISLLRQLVLILPSAYLFSLIGVEYVWIAFPLAEAVSLFISIFMFMSIYNKIIKKLSPESLPN